MEWSTDGWIVFETDELGDNPICRLSDNAIKDRWHYARLIAAAPELLEACNAALFALQGHGPIAAQLRAIIAKAEGKDA